MALNVLQVGDDGTVLTGGNAAVTIKMPANTTVGGSSISALGTITSTSANALAVGRNGATNPVFNVDCATTSAATGLKITGAAAASGIALATISSGTNESLTIDAKGAGTVTINGTATGNVVIGKAVATQVTTNISGDGAITIASGIVTLSKGSAAAITLAAPSSQNGTRITVIGLTDFAHVITVTGGLWDGTAGANVTATFPVVKGGSITMIANGTAWYVESLNGVVCAP